MDDLDRDLEAVAGSRVLFGHQSVGRNLLAGVAAVAAEHRVALRIAPAESAASGDGPGLFHQAIGRNGDPASKCDAFASLLLEPRATRCDVAIMKFCYADLGRGGAASADAVLERYRRLVDRLRARRPEVRIVHVTLPLRAHAAGWKADTKRLLGIEVAGDRDHALRHEYNQAIRRLYAAGPLFDLADSESIRTGGTRASFRSDGRAIDTLASEYTGDGGHLNAAGQRTAARAMLRAIASAVTAGGA